MTNAEAVVVVEPETHLIEIGRPVRHTKLLFRKAFVWEKEVEDFVRSQMFGRTLNVCCGASALGDTRVDILPPPETTALPFRNGEFDTVISDPPWEISYYRRMRPFFECNRVCKVGGRVIYNAKWIPEARSVRLEEVYVRRTAQFGNVSVICLFTKLTDEYDEAGLR